VRRADAALLDTLVPQADVVLDCTDGFRIRHAINAACVRHARPLVAGAAIGFDGQLSLFDLRDRKRPGSACWACVFPPDEAFDDVACATMGVFAPLVGIVGATMAAEALKLLAGAGSGLGGRLLMLDARTMQWDTIAVGRRAGCAVCG
jgi:molybdopterin/thiamine biosynthesis adenylyltransferase